MLKYQGHTVNDDLVIQMLLEQTILSVDPKYFQKYYRIKNNLNTIYSVSPRQSTGVPV